MSDLTEVPDLMGKLDAAIAVVRADEREKALADAHARIEDLHYAINQCPIRPDASSSVGSVKSDDNLLIGTGYQLAVNDALAALNQPQTEKMCRVCRNVGPPGYNCSECDGGGAATEKCPEDCDGFGQLIGDSDGPCPACSGLESDGGGAATAADADLELPLTDSTLVEEVVAAVYEACLDRAMDDPDAIEVAAVLRGELTGTRAATEPGPYAKAFREKFPVPEFPGIKNRQEDQA